MEPLPGCNIKYLNISRNDEAWGLVVTTAGYQAVAAHSSYPQAQHPESHIFDPGKGRVLKEYQLVYISRGEGYFESRSCRRQRIRAGTMILLFPGEWHTYEPDRATGWFEHWVGFRGGSVDAQVANGFFSPRNPLFGLGFSQTIIGMYEELVGYALREQAGYQQVAAGIVQFLLGSVYYKHRNLLFNDSMAIRKIDERAPSSNARSRAVSRRRGSPNACRSAIRGSARCSGSMPEPRLRNISRRSGSCVPKSCSIRRSSPSRRSHTGSGSRPRATFPHSSAKGRASRPSSTAASGGSPGGNLLSRRPSPGFRAARRICGSLRRHVPHRWRSGAKAPPCSSGR